MNVFFLAFSPNDLNGFIWRTSPFSVDPATGYSLIYLPFANALESAGNSLTLPGDGGRVGTVAEISSE